MNALGRGLAHRCSRFSIPHAVLATAGLLGPALFASGCAGDLEAQAQARETRLAGEPGLSFFSHYSPDGNRVAFSFQPECEDDGPIGIWIAAADGSGMRPVFQDSLKALLLGWREDGEALFVLTLPDRALKEIGIDGRVQRGREFGGLAQVIDVSPDGNRVLLSRFNGDNYDVGIHDLRTGGDAITFLAETPQWERDGCFGPGGESVTFVRQANLRSPESEILVWSSRTGSVENLDLPRGRLSSPAWSPDGRILAFTSNAAGNDDIWLHDTGTGSTLPATSGPDDESDASWSPDGASITFTRHSATSHLVLVEAATGRERALTGGEALDRLPVLSPDASRAAFVRTYPGSEGLRPPELCIVDTASARVRTVDLDGLTVDSRETVMSWSPDSREIAFAAVDATGNLDVYRVDHEGGVPLRVTITPGMDLAPVWSPDGSMIGFTRVAGGETSVWVIPATGGLPRRISPGDRVTQLTIWSGDSREIAYHVITDDNRNEIWITSVAGAGAPARVAESSRMVLPVGWSADGSEVLLWRVEDRGSRLCAARTDGSGEADLGEIERGDFLSFSVSFNERGERYRDRIYRNGYFVATDGESRAGVWALRVRDLLRAAEVAVASEE